MHDWFFFANVISLTCKYCIKLHPSHLIFCSVCQSLRLQCNERINNIYNIPGTRQSTIIVIIIFFEKLAQPARTVDYPLSLPSLAFCFNIHSNTQSAKTFLAGFGKRGENASFSAKEIRFWGGSQGNANGSISQRISDERRKRYFRARNISLRMF